MTTPPHHHPLLALTYPAALLGAGILICAWGLTHESAAGTVDDTVTAEVQSP
ncbi:hypothetical protein [Methylobacterium oryzihabitans]|uniref:hypothetical protein n=1 Tax=Methylobacterium oryzihabitans TaxID=2499852 RepID=UPI0016520687|nr:hypothetical protein [Methylobacterium oryzihabitans]